MAAAKTRTATIPTFIVALLSSVYCPCDLRDTRPAPGQQREYKTPAHAGESPFQRIRVPTNGKNIGDCSLGSAAATKPLSQAYKRLISRLSGTGPVRACTSLDAAERRFL